MSKKRKRISGTYQGNSYKCMDLVIVQTRSFINQKSIEEEIKAVGKRLVKRIVYQL